MSISTITRKVDDLGNAWEQFKELNDRRLREIEKKGSADAVTIDHLNKINNALDNYKSRVDSLEVVLNRPMMGGMEYKNNISHETAIEHKEAFINYVRKGIEGDLSHLEKKALSSGSDADGGYLLTPNMSGAIAKAVFETSPMRKVASIVTVSTDQLDVIQDNDSAAAAWASSETASVSDSNSPTIGKVVITAHELVAQPKATQRLIDDSSIDIEAWLTEKLAEIFSRTENTAFISGNGSGKPKGILAYGAGTASDEIEQVNSGSAGAVTSDGIIKLFYALKDEYAQNANFFMNRATVQAIRLLKESSTNQYLWQPGLASGQPDSLLGVPVVMASDMPVPANNSLSIAVGDFKRAYQIVDRTGIRILRDPYTEKPYVKFYTTKRVGGEVVLTEAIKILKLAA
ncbi:MAG TPA: phage major capsid protein [Alphaproteobacteria bacterium]|nr:phage major capsid protein [Alphaproteobacteria bacterium]